MFIQRDADLGLTNVVVFLDQNDNGLRDASERFTLTDWQGKYAFTGLVPGSYLVRQEPPAGWIPVVPPKSNRLAPWQYDKALYRRRNEVERLFRRLKGFRRIFSRFDKLDVLFLAFLNFALIIEALR